ncbi:hypothetical protein [Moritella viscosa]|uniref:DNA-directed RNA polymerase subunit alpha-RNA polymerase subunit alpha-Transcriptase subunit alpha n=1 Tax=Moritella viscosa TaxID=80854 RepID=A0ABY1HJA0_9GAMM|nr:hypothetical protein [Moritella viscosa]SGZ01962.1 DNA-directed RNA polymerase subunit alpha-RNA polymerase subunit alpha-Transcriptase subunit alpha [Moritella viscosa]
MTKLIIDNIVLNNFSLNIDPTFGAVELAENPAQKDRGLVVAKFEIEGVRVEYQEWYSVENARVGQTDTMHPNSTSTLAEKLDCIIDELQDQDRAYDFYKELDSYIESEIVRLGK